MTFPILIGTTLTTVLQYRAECDYNSGCCQYHHRTSKSCTAHRHRCRSVCRCSRCTHPDNHHLRCDTFFSVGLCSKVSQCFLMILIGLSKNVQYWCLAAVKLVNDYERRTRLSTSAVTNAIRTCGRKLHWCQYIIG